MFGSLLKKCRVFRTATLGMALLVASAWASAQGFPSKLITLIVGFPAGGQTDIQARALAAVASKELGQPIVVLNQLGVSATLAPANMARSAARDGYTFAVKPNTLFRMLHLQKVAYDPLKSFSFIANATAFTFTITVQQDALGKNVEELLAYAKANPGKLSYGTAGKGSTSHFAVEHLAKLAGVKFNSVPFKGADEVFTSLIGGHIDFAGEAGFGTYVDSGKLRLLGDVFGNAAHQTGGSANSQRVG